MRRLLLAGFLLCTTVVIGAAEPLQSIPERTGMVRMAGDARALAVFDADTDHRMPGEWEVEGSGAKARMVDDPGLEGGGYLQIDAPGESEAILRIPVGAKEAGRLDLRIQARSPQAKWWQISVRDQERSVWNRNVQLSSSWRTLSWSLPLPSGGGFELEFTLGGPGAVDLKLLHLELVDEDARRKAALDRFGGTPPVNLLRNSRLPLGLQSGWSLDRSFDDERNGRPLLEPDPSRTGPSGFPALRIAGDKGGVLYSEPFVLAEPGEMHTASFSVWGDAEGIFSVLQDGAAFGAAVEWESRSGSWERVSVTFPTSAIAESYALRIESDAPVWVDAFQVSAGEKDSTYRSSGLPEVALGVSASSRILFDDSDQEVTWMVTAGNKGEVLRGVVVDIYGEEAVLPEVVLGKGGTESGKWSLEEIGVADYGPLRIEAWLEDADGSRMSPYNELVVLRLKRPRHWNSKAPESPFGVHVPTTGRHLAMAKGIGMNWIRLHDADSVYWHNVERQPDVWVYPDDKIRKIREADFEILGLLGTTPLWENSWSGDKRPIHSFWDKWGAPADLEAFAEYARRIADRYAGEIPAYEIWNEPWVPLFFSSEREPREQGRPLYFHSDQPQADYSRLSRALVEAFSGMPEPPFLVGLNSTAGESISNRISGTEWTKGVLETGGLDGVEALSYHHYTTAPAGYPGDDVERGFERAVGPVREAPSSTQEVWLTEGSNTPGGVSSTFYKHAFPASAGERLVDESDALARYVLAMLAAGNQKIFLYSMHAHGVLGGTYRFATLVTPDGYLHPAAAAFSNLAWHLEGKRFIGREQDSDTGATLYRFAGSGESVVVWVPRIGEPVQPPDSGAEDLYGNPLNGPTDRIFYVVRQN